MTRKKIKVGDVFKWQYFEILNHNDVPHYENSSVVEVGQVLSFETDSQGRYCIVKTRQLSNFNWTVERWDLDQEVWIQEVW